MKILGLVARHFGETDPQFTSFLNMDRINF